MSSEGIRERKLEERICCEDGCDRSAAHGDVRCELHVLRMGGTLLPAPGPKPVAVVEAPVLDALVPMRAVEPPQEQRRAGGALAGAGACQALTLGCLAALLETLRFLDFHGLEGLPNLALFEVPYSHFLNVYVPMGAWVLLTGAQLWLAGRARRATRPGSRRAAAALLATGVLTALATIVTAAGPVLWALLHDGLGP